MNNTRARDYFSDYYEGAIDPALRQAFESRLHADPDLQAEYQEFVSTMELLADLPNEEIEPPIYLSDRIATRLDAAFAERQTKMASGWMKWIRSWAVPVTAGLAIILLAASGTGNSARAFVLDIFGFRQGPVIANELEYALTPGGNVEAVYNPSDGRALLVNGESKGATSNLHVAFDNPNDTAFAFEVAISGRDTKDLIVVPGRVTGTVRTGNGTVIDLAKAAADRYRVPIRISGAPGETTLTWNFTQETASDALKTALDGTDYSMDKRSGIFGINRN